MTNELVDELRVRVHAGYYDLPEVIDAVARRVATRARAWG